MLGPLDALPTSPRRIVVAGVSGAGKSALAGRLARILGLRHFEIDSLIASSGDEAGTDRWVTAWDSRPLPREVADRADTVVVLEPSSFAVTASAALRAVGLRRHAVSPDRDLAVRLEEDHPHLQVVRLTSRREVEQFVFAAGTHRADQLEQPSTAGQLEQPSPDDQPR